jgi:hypothetical protein
MVWASIPWYIKYPLIGLWFIVYAPTWIGEKFDQRWDVKAAPHFKERDVQFKNLEQDLQEIKQSTYRIEGILMEKK